MLSKLLIQIWLLMVTLRFTSIPSITFQWPRLSLPKRWGRTWTTMKATRKTLIGIRLQIMIVST